MVVERYIQVIGYYSCLAKKKKYIYIRYRLLSIVIDRAVARIPEKRRGFIFAGFSVTVREKCLARTSARTFEIKKNDIENAYVLINQKSRSDHEC